MKKIIKLTLLSIVSASLSVACSDENLTPQHSVKEVSENQRLSQSGPSDTPVIEALEILSFTFDSLHIKGTIHKSGNNHASFSITAVVPDGTSLEAMTPTIVASSNTTGIFPASGTPQDFTRYESYQITGPPPFFKVNYSVVVNFEHDFLILSDVDITLHPGRSFSVSGNFGQLSSEYAVDFTNMQTGQKFSGITPYLFLTTMSITAPVQSGQYEVSIKRTTSGHVIEKIAPGIVTVL